MIVRAQTLLDKTPHPDEAQIRRHMEPNLCRCGTLYAHSRGDPASRGPGRRNEIMKDAPVDAARRHFLVDGSLMVSFAMIPGAAALAQGTTEAGTFEASAPKLPGSLKNTPMLDAWIKVGADGRVSTCTGKAELGTGVRTALLQLVAEELELPPQAITLITADTAATPNEDYTAGSHTMADSGTAILNAAAQVRGLLVASAAAQLGVDAATLSTRDGAVVAPDGRRVTYGEAVRNANLHRNAQPGIPTKPPARYTVIGHALPRVDIPGKVTGGPSYVQDLRLPGMVHARVVRPPGYGATLVSVDLARVRALPGVIGVVRNGSYLAVVADDEWRAIVAMRELARVAQWKDGQPLPDPGTIHDTLMRLPAQEIVVVDQHARSADAITTLHARFSRPYMTHGSIGPACAVAHLDDGDMTVWTHTQGVYPLRKGLAEMLAMPLDKLRCVHVEGSGCYGHNVAADVAADAALIARELPGRPMRVQLMREQEHLWEPSARR
ncbi:Isoquinoline 1-oxidoreductase beta subunit [Candidatus Paraburkholderia kirkii UZHbot1]|uniref:Isoquinoline 1-oxidoreductase beta subunit n=1 Tax=Candidatus Paraburkholderia kirkii UZHbot1 TaxID=1055526 RepID=G4MFX3_9BURK|nr:Isoquinoline 1-oxidoreductase beta subunit [Candidatus Paraburkholderia kirkii UZHbot1]